MSDKMSHETLEPTPYERFLRESIDREKKRSKQLSLELTKAGALKKMRLKRELNAVNQNIQVVSADLNHYLNTGLEWLREPSKERDEKAESLKPVPIEAITGQVQKPATASSQPGQSAPVVGRPVAPAVGRPVVGQPRPSSTSTSGTGQPAQSQTLEASQNGEGQSVSPSGVQKPSVRAPRVGTPIIGKPVGTPVVGRPIGTPLQAPRIGTPMGTPTPKKGEEKEGDEDKSQVQGSAQQTQNSSATDKSES
jgi:hypothetical protein